MLSHLNQPSHLICPVPSTTMHEIDLWIQDAVSLLGVSFMYADREQAQDLLREARSTYVENNPRVWWLSLKLAYKQISSDTSSMTSILREYKGDCWFVPETETEEVLVYKASISSIEKVLAECPFFEYYVLADDLSWLLIESDHNMFFFCERGNALPPEY